MSKGEWYIDEDLKGGAARVVEVGAGGRGTPGHVAVFEMREDAEFCVEARNRGRRVRERLARRLARLQEDYDRLCAILGSLEWSDRTPVTCRVESGRVMTVGGDESCPACKHPEHVGHDEDCEIDAVLSGVTWEAS